jgi:signal transduction histidine kinase
MRELAPRSLIVVPLLARGELLGALVLVSSHPTRRYGEEDLRLAEEIASRAALAIENARLYQNASNATRDLREANQQMVSATIRAQELTEEAEEAKARVTQSERELREVAEFREMFIGIVGHDLRNPLGAIAMTAASLLRGGHLDEQAQNQVARIIRSKERMTKMIAQLLDLTRVRLGGGFPFEPKPTDLRDVCRHVVEEFEAPIHLEVEGDVTGSWDPDRLAEALSNIAGNAVEHAAPGTAVVVKAHADGPEVVVEIINHGDPIPGDVLPFIFEPFRRAEQGRKSAAGNLGLGLYIAKQIVGAGAGTLAAYSAEGTTTFLMRLPRHLPSAELTRQADGHA